VLAGRMTALSSRCLRAALAAFVDLLYLSRLEVGELLLDLLCGLAPCVTPQGWPSRVDLASCSGYGDSGLSARGVRPASMTGGDRSGGALIQRS